MLLILEITAWDIPLSEEGLHSIPGAVSFLCLSVSLAAQLRAAVWFLCVSPRTCLGLQSLGWVEEKRTQPALVVHTFTDLDAETPCYRNQGRGADVNP